MAIRVRPTVVGAYCWRCSCRWPATSVEVKIDVAQVASFDRRGDVIVPVAFAVAPPRVATSLSEPLPRTIGADACVVIVGSSLATLKHSLLPVPLWLRGGG